MAQNFKQLESAHWLDKMKTLFRTLDRDGKGYITLRDNQRSPRRMVKAFKLSKEKANAMLDYTRRVGWVNLVNAGKEPRKGHRVTEKTFVENMAQAVNSAEDEDIATTLVRPHLIFLLDLKEEGFITKEDYMKISGAQLVDEEISKAKFDMLDTDKDGRITVEEYTKDVRVFFTNTDLDHHAGDDPVVCSSQGTKHNPARKTMPKRKLASRKPMPKRKLASRKPKRKLASLIPPAPKKIRLANGPETKCIHPHHITMFGRLSGNGV